MCIAVCALTWVQTFYLLLQVVRKLITVPDLQTLNDKLASLKRNVYRSLPTVRFGSSRDASCYRRAKVHLITFKVCMVCCVGGNFI